MKKRIKTHNMSTESKKNMMFFMTPAILGLLISIAGPLLYALVISFFDKNLRSSDIGDFVGISNYISALTDEYFLQAAGRTALFAIGVVMIEFCLGLLIAIALNNCRHGKAFFMTVILIPMMITPVAVGLIWKMLLNPSLGIVNYIMSTFGIAARDFIGDGAYAMGTLICIDVWQNVPYMVLVIMAGLATLPVDPYEAAFVDGASRVKMFFEITIPLLLPTFSVVILLRLIQAFKTYDLVYILTKGGPGTTTEVISYHIFQQAFRYMDAGRAAAMSFILLLALIPVSAFFVRLSKNRTV